MYIKRTLGLAILATLFATLEVGAGDTANTAVSSLASSVAPLLARAEKAPIITAALAGSRIVAAGDFGIVILSDDGKNFRQAKAVPTRTVLTGLYFLDDKHGWASGHDGTVLATSDGGETWQVQRAEAGKDRVLLSVWFENPQHGLVVGQFGLALETRDGGKSWHERRLVEGEAGERHMNQIFSAGDGLVFVAAEAGTLLRSADGGATWSTVQTDNKGSFWTGLAHKDGNVIAAGMRGHVYRSADKGLTWHETPSNTQQSITSIVRMPDGELRLLGNSGLVLSSKDQGASLQVVARADRTNITAAVQSVQGLRLFALSGLLPEK